MSGIYIPGMEIPKDCSVCRFMAIFPVDDYEIMRKCVLLEKLAKVNVRRSDCPLIEQKHEKWIPVTERLPEEEEVVLVWGGTSVYTAKRHNKYGGLMWWKLNSKQHYCNPTHWMPLPQPPKDGEA